MSGSRHARGPDDPTRRDRIITAALTVIGTQGLGALTHRAVAARARVPLGSTTYYFATLDDVLEAALDRAIRHYDAALWDWASSLGELDRAGLADAITELIMDWLDSDRARLVVEYEISLAAISRPRLRGLVSRYTTTTVQVLSAFTTPLVASALTAAIDGLCIRALTHEQPPQRDEIRAALAAILTPHHG